MTTWVWFAVVNAFVAGLLLSDKAAWEVVLLAALVCVVFDGLRRERVLP